MKNNKIKDLSGFGDLWDQNGDIPFKENLKNAFCEIEDCGLLDDKKKKYEFLVSKCFFPKIGDPYRDSFVKKGTIRTLFNLWKKTFSEPFDKEELISFREEKSHYWENYRKEAERKSAWGAYGAYVRSQNEQREYAEAEKLPTEQKEKKIKELKNRTNHLVIG